jgi:hypothetical protein
MFHYLLIVMKNLTKEMNRVAEDCWIWGVCLVPTAPKLTHALYVDNVIIFDQATKLVTISGMVEHFGQHSGMKVNLSKSIIWFSVRHNTSKNDIL